MAELEMAPKILVIFGSIALYGMERAVIETFDMLRPEVEPHFLISQTPRRLGLPLFEEVTRRKLKYSFLSDHSGWERLAKPSSPGQFFKILHGLVRGNLDALAAVRRQQLLYVPNLFASYYSLLALIFCRLTGRRTIYHFHDLYSAYSRQLRFITFFLTDFVHNTSYGLNDMARTNPYILKKRNSVIPCPVRNETGPELNGDENQTANILFVGQVARHKGVDILIDAFARLAKNRWNLTLNMLGGCEDHQLQEQISHRTFGNNCSIKWWGYRSDVESFLSKAYVYVHPSPSSRFRESLGVGMIEAMASGVPGVCFRSGALQEVVVNEKTGLICDEETPEALSKALEQFLDDKRFRDDCGKRARQRFEDNYSVSTIKQLWLTFLGGTAPTSRSSHTSETLRVASPKPVAHDH